MTFRESLADTFKLNTDAIFIDTEGVELVVYLPAMPGKEDIITMMTTLAPSGLRTSVVFADDPYVFREVRTADEVVN